MNPPSLIDPFGRRITYLRLSVTDRCDLRCLYCMDEDVRFVPRRELLSLEELEAVGRAFVRLGVERIRITGGEPLVRRGVVHLAGRLAALPGLRELTLTTNGTQLARHARALRAAGVARLNISLDSLRPERFRRLSRVGRLEAVLAGIEAARRAGFRRIKINTVVLRGYNEDEVTDLLEFALARGLDISYIEEMPLGRMAGRDRAGSYCSSGEVLKTLRARHSLRPAAERSGGPSRYYRVPGHPSRIGFISPHSRNFCGDCNRVRLTARGRLLLCLGREHSVDLREVLRTRGPGALPGAIRAAMALKPAGHEFQADGTVAVPRFMHVTGG